MKTPWFWLALARATLVQRVMPPSPGAEGDDSVVTDALQIRRTLFEIARLQRPVALHAADGHFVASAALDVSSNRHLVLRLGEPAPQPATRLPWPLNATASSPGGIALFTLDSGELGAHGMLQARWPGQLIQAQSRRHYRLTGLGGAQRRAWLSRPGHDDRLRLRDLSEEGVGVELSSHTWLWPDPFGAAVLHLDDEAIPVPLLQVVHSKHGTSGNPGTLGARLLGISADNVRTLRRWIVAAQAGVPNAAGDQA